MNIDALYDDHSARLKQLCYHITGSLSDAEDCCHHSFEALLSSPPTNTTKDLSPWLTRVAINRAYDMLRQRKRSTYKGPWLPYPISTSEFAIKVSETSPETHQIDKQYISYAFMTALEVLSPQARIIWLLRELYGASTKECATQLGVSQSVVKTALHRARATMDEARMTVPWTQSPAALEQAWFTWLAMTQSQDMTQIQTILDEHITLIGDSAGHYATAYRPVIGLDRVVRFLMGTSNKGQLLSFAFIDINGAPAMHIHVKPNSPRLAEHMLIVGQLNTTNQWVRFYIITAPEKIKTLIT